MSADMAGRDMAEAVAIVGAGCRFPDAAGPDRLWELVMARRRAFRPIPKRRLNLDDYGTDGPDGTYVRYAAVLEGWRFDRARHRVPGQTYRAADPAHWLALDVAVDTLHAAGFPAGAGLDLDRVGVFVGNTMAGEFSRAALMRLRWPYVRAVVDEALAGEGWDAAARGRFIEGVERTYKAPFPEPTDESLVGGLANTIAGRICNYFGLRGGGYTVDGACASSLLAVTAACAALANGDVDFALAGGVDLSLDPFELVGFARTGALAADAMRVYDERPTGFWPGEGCGMVALMRADEAVAAGRGPLALVRGWGVSSDGQGGMTRPEKDGQLLAIRRAYERAGFGPETVTFFEGHGTGTAVGDDVEIRALAEARAAAGARRPAALGTIKANIGHTKAAAGAAGLIKAAMALQRQVIPPTTGCERPHELLRAPDAQLRVVPAPAMWPAGPLRAGVSAMGFGGINTHVVLESAAAATRRTRLTAVERRIGRRPLDHEVYVFGADSADGLAARLDRVAGIAAVMSLAESVDLAATAADAVGRSGERAYRVALVAGNPAELERRASAARGLLGELDRAPEGHIVTRPGTYAGRGRAARVGLLFPGQGAPVPPAAGALGTLLPGTERFFADVPAQGPWTGSAGRPSRDEGDGTAVDTAVAQPALVRASLAALRWLDRLGVAPYAAVGHSLGEITALHWAGALTEEATLDLVTVRGRLMSDNGTAGTGMASIAAGAAVVGDLIHGTDLVVAADNGTAQVVAGPLPDVDRVVRRARAAGVPAQRLPVSHAFHSPAVAAAEAPLDDYLRTIPFGPVGRRVYSTVNGRLLGEDDDLRRLLARQITGPVRFGESLKLLAADCELLVEVGPGRSLASLAAGVVAGVHVVAIDAGAESAEGLCATTGALFAAGVAGDVRPLFTERFHRPFDIERQPVFLENPCEQVRSAASAPVRPSQRPVAAVGAAPAIGAREAVAAGVTVAAAGQTRAAGAAAGAAGGAADVAAVVRRMTADLVELPAEAIAFDDRLLGDLHLNSLQVVRLAAGAATACARRPPDASLALADATVGGLAEVIEALSPADAGTRGDGSPLGVAEWHHVLAAHTVPLDVPNDQERFAWRVHGDGPLRPLVEPLLLDDPHAAPAHVVFLPEDPDDAATLELVDAVRTATRAGSPVTVVDHGDTASGFLATICQEYPAQAARWVRAVPGDAVGEPAQTSAMAGTSAMAETIARVLRQRGEDDGEGYSELTVDHRGRAATIVHRPLRLDRGSGSVPLDESDVVLVTGGGKGIGFATAAALAGTYGVRLGLIGRADPSADEELRRNLRRLRESGATFRYEIADVADAVSLRYALTAIAGELGAITVLLHGSGMNRPARFAELDDTAYATHAVPKHHGLRAVLNTLDPLERKALRILITYGSVIGRFGLPGEAHYALANGRMRELVRTLAAELPDCWACNVDWTVWSGAGMGERLDVLDGLVRAGVTPLPVDRGVDLLLGLLATRPAGVSSVTVTGRLPQLSSGGRPGNAGGGGARRHHRFVERVRAHTPGVELVAEAELSRAADPYLADHRIDGLYVVPAVLALEAMAQAAAALTGDAVRTITEARFDRPVIVPADGTLVLRTCALLRDDGDVDVVLRSDETDFAVDHFSGRVTSAGTDAPDVPARRSPVPDHDGAALYGPLFFHGPRFRRLIRYDHLEATGCTAALMPAPEPWRFGPGLPGKLVLGDPAGNDASIHVLQACVPQRRLLPVGCDEFAVYGAATPPADDDAGRPLVLAAVERAHEGADYTYDVVVRDAHGETVLAWRGLRLRDVGPIDAGRLARPLIGPYLERGVQALLPGVEIRGLRLAPDDRGRLGVVRPADTEHPGTEPADTEPFVCDWEWVARQDGAPASRLPTSWTVPADQLRRLTGEPDEQVRTRLRTVRGCLAKAGRPIEGPLTIQGVFEQGWVHLRAGDDDVASALLRLDGDDRPAAVAVLAKGTR